MIGLILMDVDVYPNDVVIADLGGDMGYCELYLPALEGAIFNQNVTEVHRNIISARRYLGKVARRSIDIVGSHSKGSIVNEVRSGLKKIDISYKDCTSIKTEKLNVPLFLHEFTSLFIDMDRLLSYFLDSAYEAYEASFKSEEDLGYGLTKKEYDPEVFKKEYAKNLIATKGIMPEITKLPVGKTETEATEGETT